MRTFIAIDLNPEIKITLSQLIKELDDLSKGTKNIKWISSEGMHLTLKFLGEIEQEKIPEIKNSLKWISDKQKSFTMKFRGTGCFPPGKRKPRVLWVGIEEEEALILLQDQLEKEFKKLGFSREKRKFHPHLTLGRVKNFSNLGQILTLFDHYRNRNFGKMKVEKITFFQSILKPTGAEYSILSEFEFK